MIGYAFVAFLVTLTATHAFKSAYTELRTY